MAQEIEELKEGIEPMLTRVQLMVPIIEKLMTGEMKMSYTGLVNFIDSPKDYADYKLQKIEPTKRMIYGGMLHCLILEPKDFDRRYFMLDDTDIIRAILDEKPDTKVPRATKKYKELIGKQMELADGRIIVDPKDAAKAKVIAHNVHTNRASARILRLCPDRELAVNWEYLNFSWHGFIDLNGEKDIADIKLMPDANRDYVDNQIKRRRLYLQQVLYGMGAKAKAEAEGKPWEPKNHHVIAVDDYGGVSVHTLHKRLLEYGMEELEHYVKLFNHAIITEAWDDSQNFYGHPYTGTFVCEKSGWMMSAEF